MRTLARGVTYILIAAVIAMSLSVTWTTGLFWGTLLACAAAGLGILIGQRVIASREDHDDDHAQDGPPATCAIDGCTNPAATLFYSPTGVLHVCRSCAGAVSEWTGPAIFDQNESGVA